MNQKLLMIIIIIFIIFTITIIFFSLKVPSNNNEEVVTENTMTNQQSNSINNTSIVLTEEDKQILINHIKSIEDPEDRAFYIERFYRTKLVNTGRSKCTILIKIGFLFRKSYLDLWIKIFYHICHLHCFI